MKIATFNVNGINGRLPVLLRWLAETAPDVVCLQELKAPQERFPAAALRDAGYGAIWHGQKSWNGVAILARGADPIETGRGLPGDPEDTQSRYIEAAVAGVLVGCLYLPNGNPAPGPKFDYKLRWFERLSAHAAELLERGVPVVLAGDFNVMPTELDVYKPERWVDDALFRPEVRRQKAWIDRGRWHRAQLAPSGSINASAPPYQPVLGQCRLAAPEIMAALARVNAGPAQPYGQDAETHAMKIAFSDLFGTEVWVMPVSTGTAANAIALSALTRRRSGRFSART